MAEVHERLNELYELIWQFVEEDDFILWNHLAERSLFLPAVLQEVVDHAHEEGLVPILDKCCHLFMDDDRALQRIVHFYYWESKYRSLDIDAERLYRNACGLLATAQVALAAKQGLSHGAEAWERLLHWGKEAAQALGSKRRVTPNQKPPEWSRLDAEATTLVNYAFNVLAQSGLKTDAARYWTLRWLSDLSTAGVRTLKVPVAFYHSTEDKGFLGSLRLTALAETKDGKGQLVDHRDMALRPFGRQLVETLERAWKRTGQSVCWSLSILNKDIPSSLPLDGDSLGAAAAVGFELLSQNRPYDSSCLITARLGERDLLEKVGHEKEKAEAVLRHGLRTFGVAAEPELTETQIKDLGERGLLVKQLKDVSKAVELASGLLTELLDYLNRFAERMGELPAYYPEGFAFDRIRQRVSVSQKRLRYREDEARAREAERRAGYFADEEARDKALKRAYQWRGAEMYEREEKEEPTVLDWDKVRERVHRGVLLGDPGYGKTWLLKHEGRRAAREQMEDLEEGRHGVNETIFPIYLRLGTLAEALKKSDGDTLEAIVLFLQDGNEYGLSERFANWVKMQIKGERCLLLLDALDEVPTELREGLLKSLEGLARSTKGRILLTSRIVGYSGPPFHLQGDEREREMELVAFEAKQVQGFVEVWFGEDPERRKQVEDALRREPSLRGLARIPLLLSFVCLVVAEGQEIPRRRAALYDAVLRLLLEGPWRPEGQREQDPDRIEAKLEILEEIAWHFATKDGKWRDLLPGSELSGIMRGAPQEEYLRETASHKRSLLWELSARDGVLVKAGEGASESKVPYLFLHRTFHEYLVAQHLARQKKEEWLAWVRPRFWFDPDWEEVIVLLAGCLEDPNPLLEALLAEPYDVFHTMLLLAGRCLAESQYKVDHGLQQGIARRLQLLMYSTSQRDRDRTARVSVLLGRLMLPSLLTLAGDWNHSLRWNALKALGEIGGSEAVEALRAVLLQSDGHVRDVAAEALGMVAGPEAIAALAEAINDSDWDVRRASALALGSVGRPEALAALKQALHDSERYVRAAAARALGVAGGPTAMAALGEALNDSEGYVRTVVARAIGRVAGPEAGAALGEHLHDPDQYTRLDIAGTLGAVSNPEAMTVLKEALHNSDWHVRVAATGALGRVGGPEATAALREALHDASWHVRGDAAIALGGIGGPESVAALREALHDADGGVRMVAAQALGAARGPEVEAALIEVLHDSEAYVREAALRSLGAVGGPEAVRVLKDALRDSDALVRWVAAEALGKAADSQTAELVCGKLLDEWAREDINEQRWKRYYELLMCLAQSLRRSTATAWPDWRRRLMPLIHFALASDLEQRLEWASDVERMYRGILEELPNSLPACSRLGWLLLRWPKREAEAVAYFKRFLEERPEDPELWNGLGCSYSQLGSHEFALECFGKAASLATDNRSKAVYLRNLVTIYLNKGRQREGEDILKQASGLDGEHPELYLHYARLCLLSGQLNEALDFLEKAFERGSDQAEVHFTDGLVLLCKGGREEAEQAYIDGLDLAEEWGEVEDACQWLEKQMQARRSLPGAAEILVQLQAKRDELMAQWPSPA